MSDACRTALCALASAASEAGIEGDIHAFFADAADRALVARAVDALSLLDPGHSAGDAASWHVALLPRGAAPHTPSWCAAAAHAADHTYAGQRFVVSSLD